MSVTVTLPSQSRSASSRFPDAKHEGTPPPSAAKIEHCTSVTLMIPLWFRSADGHTTGHSPQSAGHDSQSSPSAASQTPSPQGWQPHSTEHVVSKHRSSNPGPSPVHSTHAKSQAMVQQNESSAHTQVWHCKSSQPAPDWTSQHEPTPVPCVQTQLAPQSA